MDRNLHLIYDEIFIMLIRWWYTLLGHMNRHHPFIYLSLPLAYASYASSFSFHFNPPHRLIVMNGMFERTIEIEIVSTDNAK